MWSRVRIYLQIFAEVNLFFKVWRILTDDEVFTNDDFSNFISDVRIW